MPHILAGFVQLKHRAAEGLCGGGGGNHSQRHKESGGNSFRSDLDVLGLDNNKNMENVQ